MLRLAKLNDGDVFLDMGSGTGKACVAAGLLYPQLSVCRGVEILDGLDRQAKVGFGLQEPSPSPPCPPPLPRFCISRNGYLVLVCFFSLYVVFL